MNPVNQNNLEATPENLPPPRPSHLDREILKVAAESVLKVILAQNKSEQFENESAEEHFATSLSELVEVLVNACGHYDGYKLAKDLEQIHHWEIDAIIVDELNNISVDIHAEHSKRVKAWVKENNIKPAFKVGDHIKFKINFYEERTGVIVKIKEDVASYLAQIDGEYYPSASKKVQPIARLVQYENAIAVEPK